MLWLVKKILVRQKRLNCIPEGDVIDKPSCKANESNGAILLFRNQFL